MKKFLDFLDNKLEISICIVLMCVLSVVLFIQVFYRYVLQNSLSWSEELARYCFVWLILLSATYVFGQRDHICISFLKDKLEGSARRTMDIVIELVVILFSVLVLVYGGIVITTMNMLQYDSILKIPTGTIYSIIPISGVLIIFYSLYNIVESLNQKEGGN